MCLVIYELDPIRFLSAQPLAWQAALKKTKVELELIADIDMLLLVEKGIRGGHVIPLIDMQKLINNKYLKTLFRVTKLSPLKYWDINNLHGWVVSKRVSKWF